jgi:TRAP-type uncharacterized transport system fused permease subunit
MKEEHLLLLSDIETYKLYSLNGYNIIILGGVNMNWIQMILIIVALTVVSLFIFYAIKTYVITKFNINKRYLLILVFVFLVVPVFFPSLYQNLIVQLVQMTVVSVTFLTYMELKKIETEKKNRPVVGRPKQKLNKVKSDQKK